MSIDIQVKLDIQDLLKEVEIDKPHALWVKLGGSKSTPGTLWYGTVEGIKFNSLERILKLIRDTNPKLSDKVIHHLNASGLFNVKGSTTEPPKKDARPIAMKRAPRKPPSTKGTAPKSMKK